MNKEKLARFRSALLVSLPSDVADNAYKTVKELIQEAQAEVREIALGAVPLPEKVGDDRGLVERVSAVTKKALHDSLHLALEDYSNKE